MISRVSFDTDSSVPMYRQLEQAILEAIEKGDLKPGDALPTEMELQDQLGISRTTIRQAMSALAASGKVVRTKGKGTFVSQQKTSIAFVEFHVGFQDEDAVPLDRIVSLSLSTVPKVVQELFGMEPHEHTMVLKRVRFINDTPISLIDTYLSPELSSTMADDFSASSFYSALAEDEETKVVRAKRYIKAAIADEKTTEQLHIPAESAVLITKTTGYASNGKPVEYSVARYSAADNVLELELMTSPKDFSSSRPGSSFSIDLL